MAIETLVLHPPRFASAAHALLPRADARPAIATSTTPMPDVANRLQLPDQDRPGKLPQGRGLKPDGGGLVCDHEA